MSKNAKHPSCCGTFQYKVFDVIKKLASLTQTVRLKHFHYNITSAEDFLKVLKTVRINHSEAVPNCPVLY